MKKFFVETIFALACISYVYTCVTLADKFLGNGHIGLWIALISGFGALYLNEKKD